LPSEFLPKLERRCREAGIKLLCTPFYLAAVAELVPYVDSFKIASYELLWEDLLVACAGTGKPIVLSTGMANLNEVQRAVSVLRTAGCQELTLLHCVSGYPTPVNECNLAAIETLRHQCGCDVGWSDHSVDPAVIERAVHRWGATMIEFHLDLDGEGPEYHMGHCWLPDQIGQVMKRANEALKADGSGEKMPAQSELSERDWRADPTDGLRPALKTRVQWRE
jgi:N-acetylneuraminate synthase